MESTTTAIFSSPCPIAECLYKSRGEPPMINWVHTNCPNHQLNIDKDGNLICTKCGKTAFILDWRFKCGNEHHTEYMAPRKADILYAIALIINSTEAVGELVLFDKVIK